MFLPHSQYSSIEIRNNSIRCATLRKTSKGWKICSLKEASIDEIEKIADNPFKENTVVSAMHTRDVLMRPCEIPLKRKKDILAALEFHVEPLLPYPLDKALIQTEINDQKGSATSLNVYSIRKDRLVQHLETLSAYQIEPEIVTTRPHALAALSTFLPQTGAPLILVHESEDEISVVLIEKGRVLAARAIDNNKDFASEIQKTLLSFNALHKNKIFDSIYFLGMDTELKSTLQSISGMPVLVPHSSLSITSEELIQFGLAIGMAAISTAPASVCNFRQKEFVYPHTLKRLKKPLLSFTALSLIFAATIYLFGEVALRDKRQAIQEAYHALMKSEELNAQAEFLKTPYEYSVALNQLEKKISTHPDTFPLLPQIPKVKDVLGWLTSLAQPSGKHTPSINIESFHYQLISHPDLSHHQAKYKVRVDVELSTTDSNAARAFQEALKSSNTFIDTREEIQWAPIKGKYKASFYLKDKTKYD